MFTHIFKQLHLQLHMNCHTIILDGGALYLCVYTWTMQELESVHLKFYTKIYQKYLAFLILMRSTNHAQTLYTLKHVYFIKKHFSQFCFLKGH